MPATPWRTGWQNRGWSGGLMVCGTTSDAGKSHPGDRRCAGCSPAGACGWRRSRPRTWRSTPTSPPTAPRSAGPRACRRWPRASSPTSAMNPILLKPTGERTSQVVVRGTPVGGDDGGRVPRRQARPAAGWCSSALADLRAPLRRRAVRGRRLAGRDQPARPRHRQPALAAEAGLPAIVVGDIDRGGVFAALYGTVALLPDDLPPPRARLRRQQVPRRPGAAVRRHRRPGAPLRRAHARRPADAAPASSASTPRTRSPSTRPRPAAGRAVADAARRGRRPLPRTSRTSPTSTPLALEPGVGRAPRARAPASSAGPISSCCPARRPPSPTWRGCAPAGSPAAIARQRRRRARHLRRLPDAGRQDRRPRRVGRRRRRGPGLAAGPHGVRSRQGRAPRRRDGLRDPPRSGRGRRRPRRPTAGCGAPRCTACWRTTRCGPRCSSALADPPGQALRAGRASRSPPPALPASTRSPTPSRPTSTSPPSTG